MISPRSLLVALLITTSVVPCIAGGWGDDYKAALAAAAKDNRNVLLDFTGSDWCGWCIRLKRETFDKPEFKAYADKNLELVEIDFPQTESGFGDARVNYAEAKAALVEKRSGTAESKLPKREKSDTSPVQPAASTTRTATKVVTLPALDDATTEYVNYLKKIGNTEEQIAEMLK